MKIKLIFMNKFYFSSKDQWRMMNDPVYIGNPANTVKLLLTVYTNRKSNMLGLKIVRNFAVNSVLISPNCITQNEHPQLWRTDSCFRLQIWCNWDVLCTIPDPWSWSRHTWNSLPGFWGDHLIILMLGWRPDVDVIK